MFEKEAEEYCTRQKLLEDVRDNICNAFKDGAEFGYNKAKEEMQKLGLALQSDMDKTIEQNIALKEQIEKMKCCYNCSKDCGSIDRRICFENKMKDWTMEALEND